MDSREACFGPEAPFAFGTDTEDEACGTEPQVVEEVDSREACCGPEVVEEVDSTGL